MNPNDPLLCIALLPGLTPRSQTQLEARGPLGQVLSHPADHADLLSAQARESLRTGQAWREVEQARAEARREGYRIVARPEPDYPGRLAEIFDPPPVLWLRGELVPDDPAVAVVGSRAASPMGRRLAGALCRGLAERGVTVVSGLARGIDGAAHRGALEGHGRTVAVLGSGLARCYPAEHASLAEAIVAAGGAVVSEFPPGTPPLARNFPRRNRVVAGWGRAVVVVEAAQKSGALITARLAADEGRDVMAVPGHPGLAVADGTNQLLRDGATLVRGAADVAEELGLPAPADAEAAEPAGDPVLVALRSRPGLSLDELQQRLGLPAGELLARLSELELSSRVRRAGALFEGC